MTALSQNVMLPVTCPTCGLASLSEFPALVIVVALTRWNNLAMYAACHKGAWDASARELAQVRAHVGEAWIQAHHSLVDAPAAPRPKRGGAAGLPQAE